MITEINVTDEISPTLKSFMESNPRYFRALGKSVGWWYQREIKKELLEGRAGSVYYKERWPLSLRRKLDPEAPKAWYGKMRKAIGYEYDNGTVKIGWTSYTALRYGDLQEAGFRKTVTDRMRQFFRSRGINLSNNTAQLNIPDRPIFEPISSEMSPKVVPYVNEKISKYIDQGVTSGIKNRRKYKVY